MSCYYHSTNKKPDKQESEYLGIQALYQHWTLRIFYAPIQIYNDIIWGKIKTNQQFKLTVFKFLIWPGTATDDITFFLI